MPQQVQVDGVGLLEFSDDFTPDEIASQVDNIYARQEMAKVQGEDKFAKWFATTESVIPPLLLPPEAPGSIEAIAGKSTAGRVVSGAVRGGEQIVRGLGAPENIPLAPLALVPGGAPAMGIYFGGQAIGTGAGTLSAASTPEEVGQGIAETAVGGLMAAHPVAKAVKPILKGGEWVVPPPEIPPDVAPFVQQTAEAAGLKPISPASTPGAKPQPAIQAAEAALEPRPVEQTGDILTRRGISESDAIEMAAKDTAKGTPSEAVPDPQAEGKWAVRTTKGAQDAITQGSEQRGGERERVGDAARLEGVGEDRPQPTGERGTGTENRPSSGIQEGGAQPAVKPAAVEPAAEPVEPWKGTIKWEQYDEPTGKWQPQENPIVVSKSTIAGDKPWRATVFGGSADNPVAIGHVQLNAPELTGLAMKELAEQLGRYTQNLLVEKMPSPADAPVEAKPQAVEPPQETGPGRVSEPTPLEVKPTPIEPAAGLSLGPGARSGQEVFEVKQRKFHGRFKDTNEIQLETRKAVQNEFYSPRSHAEVNRAVNTMLEYDGIEGMIRRLLADDPTLPPDHKVAAQLNIMKRLNQQAIDLDAAGETAKANYVRDRQVELIDTLADNNATEMGRGISAYQMWNALTPEGVLRDYRHKVGLIREKALASIDQGLRGVVQTVRSETFQNAEVPAQRQMLLDAFKGLGRASKSVVGKVKVLMDAAKDPKVFDKTLMREVSEALKLPKLDEAFARDLLKRAQEAMQKPEGFQRDFAMSKLAGEIRDKLGISLREVATSWWYASILSGPPTQFVNAAAGMIRVLSDLSLLTASHPRALAQLLKGYGEGTAKGWREAVAIVKEGDYSRRESNLFEPTVLEILSDSPSALKRALSYGKYVGRVMTAADMVNYKGASEAYSRLKAWEQARKEGLRGAELQKRVDEILFTSYESMLKASDQAKAEGVTGNNFQRRVDEISEQQRDAGLNEEARTFGLEATYNQDPVGGIGAIVDSLNRLKQTEGPIGTAATFVVPFTRIVGNVFSEFLNWTPYGYWRQFRMAEQGARGTDAFRMQAMKATLGTVALPALYAAIKATEDKDGNAWFDISGPGPSDPDLRKSMMQTGWRQNSVKVGDAYIRFMNTPFAMPFALIGYLRDAEKYEKMDNKDALDRFAFTMFYAGRSVFDISFLTGLADFFEGISSPQGAKKIAGMVQRTGTGFAVPALAKWIDRVWDPTITKGDTLKERFIRDFPIARSSIGKPMLNVLGDEVHHEGSARFSWDRFWSMHKPDPIWDLFATKHVSPHMPSKSILINDKPITPEQYYDLVMERGKILRKKITDNLPHLQKMDSDSLQEWLGEKSRKATTQAKDAIKN